MVASFELPDTGWIKAFNDWYSGPHVADVLQAPGITAAQRYWWRRRDGGYRFLAVYRHSGEPAVEVTLSSPEWLALMQDFQDRWAAKTGPANWQVYRTLGIGDEYLGWPPPPG